MSSKKIHSPKREKTKKSKLQKMVNQRPSQVTQEVTAYQAYMLYKSGKLIADPRFQRPLVWSSNDDELYLSSMNIGMTVDSIITCDLASAYNLEVNNNLDEDEAQCPHIGDYKNTVIEHLKELLGNGHQQSILDSQNRLECLRRFFEDEIKLSGPFFDSRGELVDLEHPTAFKDMPPKLAAAFENKKMLITKYSVMYSGPYGAAEIFKRLNSGVPLSAQQLRRAGETSLSPYITDLADPLGLKSPAFVGKMQHGSRAKSMIGGLSNAGSGIEEFMLDLMMMTHPQSYKLDKTSRDDFYELGSGGHEPLEYSDDVKQRFEGILEVLENLVHAWIQNNKQGTRLTQISKKDFYKLLYVSEYLYDAINGPVLDELTSDSLHEFLVCDSSSCDRARVKLASHIEEKYIVEVGRSFDEFQERRNEWLKNKDTQSEPKASSYLDYRIGVPKDPNNREFVKNEMSKSFKEILNTAISLAPQPEELEVFED